MEKGGEGRKREGDERRGKKWRRVEENGEVAGGERIYKGRRRRGAGSAGPTTAQRPGPAPTIRGAPNRDAPQIR